MTVTIFNASFSTIVSRSIPLAASGMVLVSHLQPVRANVNPLPQPMQIAQSVNPQSGGFSGVVGTTIDMGTVKRSDLEKVKIEKEIILPRATSGFQFDPSHRSNSPFAVQVAGFSANGRSLEGPLSEESTRKITFTIVSKAGLIGSFEKNIQLRPVGQFTKGTPVRNPIFQLKIKIVP